MDCWTEETQTKETAMRKWPLLLFAMLMQQAAKIRFAVFAFIFYWGQGEDDGGFHPPKPRQGSSSLDPSSGHYL